MLFVCPVSSHMYNPTETGHVSPMHYTIHTDYLCITKTILASVLFQSISTRPVRPRTTSRHIHTHIYIYIYIYIFKCPQSLAHTQARAGFASHFALLQQSLPLCVLCACFTHFAREGSRLCLRKAPCLQSKATA